jgi:hypothetical protein
MGLYVERDASGRNVLEQLETGTIAFLGREREVRVTEDLQPFAAYVGGTQWRLRPAD